MQTIHDPKTRAAFIERINSIDPADTKQWGKMNLQQMLAHNVLWNQWIIGDGERKYKQEFIGFLFGKFGLKRMIKDERPIDRNVPSSSFLLVKEPQHDIETLKSQWTELVQAYANYSNPDFIHDFFGKMTLEQIGLLVYKHTDHHLRQFNR